MLEVCIQSLFRVELWAVAGQVEEFYLLCALCSPSLYRFAVVDSQVIQYQEHFSFGVLDERPQKFDQLVRVKRLINDHPTRLALIGHSRNHRQLVARTTHSPIIADQTGFIGIAVWFKYGLVSESRDAKKG